MSELAIRLRTVLGFVPIGVERIWRTAIGGGETWAWFPTAVPWVVAMLVAVLVAAVSYGTLQLAAEFRPLVAVWLSGLGALLAAQAVALLPARLGGMVLRMGIVVLAGVGGGTLGGLVASPFVALPVPVALLAGLASGLLVLARRLAIAGTARTAVETLQPVPVFISLLLVLAALPVGQASFELIVTRATVHDLVERTVGFSTTLVEVRGYAPRLPLRAEPPDEAGGFDPHAYVWLPMRDDLQARQFVLVRSPTDLASRDSRWVVARVVTDADAVAAASAELAARGHGMGSLEAERMLVELTADAASEARGVRDIRSLGELASVGDGSLVRVPLRFLGAAVATCAAADSCNPHRLGAGFGAWDQLVVDADGSLRILVRTPYPPSVMPVGVFGRQISDRGAVDRFLALPWVTPLVGWAQVLQAAMVEHDPSLPVDRLWLGPIVFTVLALLLMIGLRLGYPTFTFRPAAPATAAGQHRSFRALASGRLSPSGARPVELERTPVTVTDTGQQLELAAAVAGEGARQATMPYVGGSLTGVETGELRYVRHREPALRVSWYGSQLQLVFDTDAQRDAAAVLLGGRR